MNVALPNLEAPATIILHPERKPTDEEYFAFCEANPELRVERTARGEIVIVPPAGLESSYRNNDLSTQLTTWARKDGRGKVFDSSAQYFLPDGAALSPDASWVSDTRIAQLDKKERRRFPRTCPEFIVEVMSPSDRLSAAQAKMEEWMANGVQLGWLIYGDARTVYIYRPGQPVEAKNGVTELAGEGPVEGFTLDLTEIWAGL